jgi:signal transduction histidine kinase
LADRGFLWPVLPSVILLMLLGSHAVIAALWQHLAGAEREQQLEQRVDVLTRTRRGALEVQDAELRRVERDLHDGAQSRLVALTMQLGRAEERLSDQPEAAALVRQARDEAGAAIRELRDLARGIAPPVLADRGLGAALEALAQRSAVDAQVRVAVTERLPAVLETAAYFVVAEALTNVVKHAQATAAWVDVHQHEGALVASVSDDGRGGADPGGSGLMGLRTRVEAVDGTLAVQERPGGGTIVRAEMPCGQ